MTSTTPEDLVARAGSDPAAGFTAIRVASRLSQQLQADPARAAFVGAQLATLREGVDAATLTTVSKTALPEAEAVRFACLAITAAAADPEMRPAVEAAIAEQAASREMLGTGVMEWGIVVGLGMLIAKTEVWREPDGKWGVRIHKLDDKVLVELAKVVTEALKRFG